MCRRRIQLVNSITVIHVWKMFKSSFLLLNFNSFQTHWTDSISFHIRLLPSDFCLCGRSSSLHLILMSVNVKICSRKRRAHTVIITLRQHADAKMKLDCIFLCNSEWYDSLVTVKQKKRNTAQVWFCVDLKSKVQFNITLLPWVIVGIVFLV